MNNLLSALVTELKSPATTHVAAASAGAIAVAFAHRHVMGNGRTLALSKEAYNALVDGDTNFVRFWNDKNKHVFRVTLEQ